MSPMTKMIPNPRMLLIAALVAPIAPAARAALTAGV